jgi:hypothetical protein
MSCTAIYSFQKIKTFTKLLYRWNEIQDLLEYYIHTSQLGWEVISHNTFSLDGTVTPSMLPSSITGYPNFLYSVAQAPNQLPHKYKTGQCSHMAVTFSDDQPQGVITTVKMSTTNFTAAINSPLPGCSPSSHTSCSKCIFVVH